MRRHWVFLFLLLSGAVRPLASHAQHAFDDLPVDDPSHRSVLGPHEDPTKKIKANVFVIATTDHSTCYPGEQVQLTYRLYTALQSTSTIAAKPGFNGFTVKERKTDETPLPDKVVNDRHYHGFTIWQVLLTPLQPGDYAIDPLSVDNTVSYTTMDGKTARYSAPVSSNKAVIHVIPLPAAGQPRAFAGLVGQWKIKSRLSSTQLDVGDYDTVLVEIAGVGSFDNITTPAIVWPAGFRHFDAIERWNINDSTVPESGTKRIAIPFTANTPGQYRLPAMQLAWFDPVTKTYEVTQTDSLALRVVGTTAAAASATAASAKKSPLPGANSSRLAKDLLVSVIILIVIALFFRLRRRPQ